MKVRFFQDLHWLSRSFWIFWFNFLHSSATHWQKHALRCGHSNMFQVFGCFAGNDEGTILEASKSPNRYVTFLIALQGASPEAFFHINSLDYLICLNTLLLCMCIYSERVGVWTLYWIYMLWIGTMFLYEAQSATLWLIWEHEKQTHPLCILIYHIVSCIDFLSSFLAVI